LRLFQNPVSFETASVIILFPVGINKEALTKPQGDALSIVNRKKP
jgi:hypothetical protein